MARTTNRGAFGVVRAIGAGVAALGLSLALVGVPAGAQEARSFEMQDFGVVPRPSVTQVLLRMPAVEQELKITDAQKKEQAAIQERRFQKMQQARRENRDRDKFLAARDAIFNETAAAILANLKPEQRDRLDQIQLQAQGPFAFTRDARDPSSFIGAPLLERLKLSDEQTKRVGTIAEEGTTQIEKAASFPIALDSKDKPTVETIRKLVEAPEFRAAKEKTRRTARETWSRGDPSHRRSPDRRAADPLSEDAGRAVRPLQAPVRSERIFDRRRR